MPNPLRVLFIGMNHGLSHCALEAIAKHANLVGIVESVDNASAAPVAPTAPNKRDTNLLHQASTEFAVPYHQLGREDATLAQAIDDSQCDLIAVVGMHRRMPRPLFDRPPLGAINLHPSLLPRYRGPDPYFWQYHQMDLAGGVSVFQIDEGLDTGDLLLQKPLPIALGEPYASYLHRTAITGADALVEVLTLLQTNHLQRTPQRDLPCPLFARMLRPGEAAGGTLIDWNHWPLERAWHLLHGMHQRTPLLPMLPGVNANWSIGELQRTPTRHSPGEIHRDPQGYFVAHPRGKIRLKLIPAPTLARRLIRRVRRWWTNR